MVLTAGAVAGWSFDEPDDGDDIADSGPLGIDLTTFSYNSFPKQFAQKFNNGTQYGRSASTSAASQDKSYNSSAGDMALTTGVTMAGWFRAPIWDFTHRKCMGQGNNATGGYGFYIWSSRVIGWRAYGEDDTGLSILDTTLNNTTRRYVMGTYDATTGGAELFINNSSVGTASGTVQNLRSAGTEFGNVSGISGGAHNDLMEWDEIVVWDRVLTSDERSDAYNGGAGVPVSQIFPQIYSPRHGGSITVGGM